MLNKILSYFQNLGCIGRIITENNVYRLRFDGFKNALIIKEHFIKYPLLTYKLVHFNLWITVLNKIIAKTHLTATGLSEIIALKSHFKSGLSKTLIQNFPNYTSVPIPDYNPNLLLMNINWIAGFINADGGFFLGHRITKSELGQVIYSIHISRPPRRGGGYK